MADDGEQRLLLCGSQVPGELYIVKSAEVLHHTMAEIMRMFFSALLSMV